MADVLVTCVIPVFNAQRYIRETIQSVLDQSHHKLEVVIVDDGSTDATGQVVQSVGGAVRLLTQAHAGPAAARNLGIANALGEYLSFLDADDLWEAPKTEKQVEVLKRDATLDYCVTLMENFWGPDVPADERRFCDPRPGPVEGFSPTTLMARRRVFDKVGLFDETLALVEDWDWFVRAHDYGAVYSIVHEVLARRRLHENNRTILRAAEHRAALLPVLHASLARKKGLKHDQSTPSDWSE